MTLLDVRRPISVCKNCHRSALVFEMRHRYLSGSICDLDLCYVAAECLCFCNSYPQPIHGMDWGNEGLLVFARLLFVS